MKTHLAVTFRYAASAILALAALGCTCAPGAPRQGDEKESTAPSVDDGEVAIEGASAPGRASVTIVLDPSGTLCADASRAAAGRRHVLCDRTKKEDLSAAALRVALQKLKADRGADVASSDAWLVAAPARATVARSLAMREPGFFSRVAAWIGPSPVTAGLFGPTFLEAVAGRGFRAIVLVGPGAGQAETWADLAERSGVALTVWKGADEAELWSGLAQALRAESPEP